MDCVTPKEIYGLVAMMLLLIRVTLSLHERIELALASVTCNNDVCVC